MLELCERRGLTRFKCGDLELHFAPPPSVEPAPARTGVVNGDQSAQPGEVVKHPYTAVFGGQVPQFKPNKA